MKHERILIVDDNQDIRDILGNALKGYKLSFAEDGGKALVSVKAERPDLVILDIMMPRLNGYQFLQAINDDPSLRYIKVIIISAKALTEDQLKGFKLGALDYITKPFDKILLREKAARMISMHFYEEVLEYQRMMMRYIQHHTRTGLNMISCATEMLGLSDPDITSEGLSSVAIIREGMEQILSLVRQSEWLTDVATQKPDTAQTNLRRMLVRNEELLSHAACDMNLSLSLPEGDEAYLVHGDENLLVRSIASIVKHVAARSLEDSTVSVCLSQKGATFSIVIVGEGNAIPEDMLPNVFTPFFIDEKQAYAGFDGIDLQLPITSMVARLYGGTTTAKNLPGGHAEISMIFPLLGTTLLRDNSESLGENRPPSRARSDRNIPLENNAVA